MIADEEDTDGRITYTAHVAEAYGACGFATDFRRLYDQLVDMAFGLGSRKDYQASHIITPLEIYHRADPGGTLKRLAEVLHVQKRLANAGNGRMRHICLFELIVFTAKHYPSLGLELLEKEEKSLWREEAANIVLTPVIKQAPQERLLLLLAIIKTLPRWERKPSHENFFLDLAFTLLNRALELHDTEVVSETIEAVTFNSVVELNEPQLLERFARAIADAGNDPAQYGVSVPQQAAAETTGKQKRTPHDERFSLPATALDFPTLLKLFEEDYAKFDTLLETAHAVRCQNRILSTFRNEFHRSKSTFQNFYQSLPEPVQNGINMRRVLVSYIRFKNRVAEHYPGARLSLTDLEGFFDAFVQEISPLFPDGELKKFVDETFENEKWLENILGFANDHRHYLFSKVVPDADVLKLVREASVLHADDLLAFIRKWTSEQLQATALLVLANRLLRLNPSRAKELLHEAASRKDHNLLFPRREDESVLDFDAAETIIGIDKEFGKRFLLKSYLSQKGEYGDSLIAQLDKLLKYAGYYSEEGIEKVFFKANFQYNKELAQGLPERRNDYAFVADHQPSTDFADVAVRHLIWLFDYPMVQVRQLALQAVFDLLKARRLYLQSFIEHCIRRGNDNQVEHGLTVLVALAHEQPQALLLFKTDLLALTGKDHFNILEMTRELLLQLSAYSNNFLTVDETTSLSILNARSPIILNDLTISRRSGRNFIFSNYQGNLLYRLSQVERDETPIEDDLYTHLISSGWEEWDSEKEGAVHRGYNANTNFDTIEIQSPYYDAVKSGVNRIFHSKIRRGLFTKKAVAETRCDFRLYDPSWLLYVAQPKPDFVNWIPRDSTKESFNGFEGLKDLVNSLAHHEDDYN